MRLKFEDGLIEIHDGDAEARAVFERHYSHRVYRNGRRPKLFVGPGFKLVLASTDYSVLFVWRKFRDACIPRQEGVNCSVFRNESTRRSSEIILEAEKLAWHRWPGERLYTYVNAAKVRHKRDPGRCFRKAGWRPCGFTKVHRLLIFEKYPDA